MKKLFIAIPITLLLISLTADAQWRSKTHDVYNALTGLEIEIDGNLDEWDGVLDTVKGTNGKPFCGVEFQNADGNVRAFEEYDGGKWDGPDDHETCFMVVWDSEALYLALSVTDDEHQNSGGNAWSGDGAQISFDPTGARKPGNRIFLFNGAVDQSAKNIISAHLNQRVHGSPGLDIEKDLAIVRDESAKKTYYEFRFSANNLLIQGGKFSEGDEVGLDVCVNDGDLGAGQNGQKGWSGWYAHSIVHGNQTEKMGLVVLTADVLAVEPLNKLTTTWGKLKR